MRVLITGAGGQIGRALTDTVPPGDDVQALSQAELDLTRAGDVARVVREYRPELVINAAGYTAVDRAEAEPDAARAVNEEGARSLAEAVAGVGGRMLHYSTDYVFDGTQSRPHAPDERPNPLNVYGVSKLAGERAVLDALEGGAVVLRTAWVYAATGHNFLRTMLGLLSGRDHVKVVSDQIGSPTSARSVALATWAIARRPDMRGILHWTDAGVASWYDFAVAIEEEGRQVGLLQRPTAVVPVTTEEYPTPACRPRYSVLDCSATRAALGMTPDHWRVALRRTLRELVDA